MSCTAFVWGNPEVPAHDYLLSVLHPCARPSRLGDRRTDNAEAVAGRDAPASKGLKVLVHTVVGKQHAVPTKRDVVEMGVWVW